MIEIKYTTRVFPQKYGAIAIRVRWNHKKNEVEFTTGDWAESEKWDSTSQRAAINTKHVVRGHVKSATEINRRIGVVLGYVEQVFADFAHAGEVPDNGAFRAAMSILFEKENEEVSVKKKSLTLETMATIVNKYVAERSIEDSWKSHSKYKYTQIVGHLLKVKPGIRIDQIDKEALLALRTWLYKQKHHNSSIARWLDALKAVSIPTVEVHISKVDEREPFRQISYVSYYASKTIIGKGLDGYIEAIDFLADGTN